MTEGEKTEASESETQPVNVGIKIGSQRTAIAADSYLETFETCIGEKENPLTGKKEYIVGNEAADLFGDEANYMLRGGLPGSEEEAELLKVFLNRIANEKQYTGR